MQTTKEKLIAATQTLIQEKNSTDVRLTEVADRVGITHGAIYKHFKNKGALLTDVALDWFNTTIIQNIHLSDDPQPPKSLLHEWLWQFVNAKKQAYQDNPGMFALNATYVEADLHILKLVLLDSMKFIDQLMQFNDPKLRKSEAILASFSVFTLPSFKSTWTSLDYQERFEVQWQLIEAGL